MNVLLLCPEEHRKSLIGIIDQASGGVIVCLHFFTNERSAIEFLQDNDVDLVIIISDRSFKAEQFDIQAQMKGVERVCVSIVVIQANPKAFQNLIRKHLETVGLHTV